MNGLMSKSVTTWGLVLLHVLFMSGSFVLVILGANAWGIFDEEATREGRIRTVVWASIPFVTALFFIGLVFVLEIIWEIQSRKNNKR